jgi:hypothetical protein
LAGWYLTSGDSARTPVPSGLAVTVPPTCGAPPETPKSPGPVTGVFSAVAVASSRWSIVVTALLPARRCSASTRAGVIGAETGPSGTAPPRTGAMVGAAASACGTGTCSDSTRASV